MRLAAIALFAFATLAPTHAASLVGTWQTFDDDTHAAKALVEITNHAGVLSGKIVKLFPAPGEDADPRCTQCAGTRHDQRVVGMTILWNFRRDGDHWSGGEVLDPESGDVYRAILHPRNDGKTLDVHGYIGIPLLGRSQIWTRAAD